MAKRIDTLTKGAKVTLAFYYRGKISTQESAEFVGLEGEGESRRAKFRSPRETEEGVRYYDWEAYRYHKRWSYGTSADRLTLVSVEI